MANQESFNTARFTPGHPWPQWDELQGDPDYPVVVFDNFSDAFDGQRIVPVDPRQPVIKFKSFKEWHIQYFQAVHFPDEPELERLEGLPTVDYLRALYHAIKYRMVILLSISNLVKIALDNEDVPKIARIETRTYVGLANQIDKMVDQWYMKVPTLDEESKNLLAEQLKAMASGWKFWAEI